jgi:HlyD family secretion protein
VGNLDLERLLDLTGNGVETMTQTIDGAKPRRSPLPLILGALVFSGIGYGFWVWINQPKAGELKVSGLIEGYETDVGAKTPGRIDEVTVREGDSVKKGQLLVRLDDSEIQAQLRGAEARINAAKQQARQAQLQLGVLKGQITQAQLILQQSKGDAEGRVNQADAQVAAAQAQQAQAQAQVTATQSDVRLAQLNRNRFAQLLKEGATSQQQFDQTQANLESAQANLKARLALVVAARRQVSAAQGSLTQTQTATLNPQLRDSQLAVVREQLAQAQSQFAAAQADVVNAEATKSQLQAQIAYLNILSPIGGVVTSRSVEPGAVVTAGKTLLSVIDLDRVYLRGYVPEGSIGKVRVGQQAKVYLDSDSSKPYTAHIAVIDPKASFTPENIYFKDERVKQVFGVKIVIDQPGGYVKPGMPADAEILVGESKP